MKRPSLYKFEVLDLLGLYSDILNELYSRGVIRTVNNPAADYSEFLITEVFSFNPAPPSMKGYDAIGEDGIRYEIKARRLTPRSKPTRFSAIRSFDEGSFDKLVAILFNEDFSVNRAFIFPRDYIQEKAYWQEHVNGWILPINDSLWDEKFGQDITKKLQKHQTLSVA